MSKKLNENEKQLNLLVLEQSRFIAKQAVLQHQLRFIQDKIDSLNEQIILAKNKALGPGRDLTAEEKALAVSDGYINAIKSLRNRTDLGLKEAKDVVDAYRHSQGYPR
jgi:ribosomal protein L7/L12